MIGNVVSAVIRFASHLPLGFYFVTGLRHWKLVKQHAGILLGPPLSHTILVGEQFAGPGGTFAFAWNFVMWIPTMLAKGPFLLFLGIVDALIVAVLIVATTIEGTYVGKTTHECAQVSLDGSTDRSLIFFERAGAINATDTDYGRNLCNDFRITFNVGIAMIILYGISAFANISSGTQSWRDASVNYGYSYSRHNSQRYNRRGFSWDRNCLKTVVTFPFIFLWSVIVGTTSCMLSCLPKRMQQPIRFSSRVAGKWGYHTTASAKGRLGQIHHLARSPHKKVGSDRALETILLYDILLLIAPKLHYVDFVNLSMASKRVRAAVFPLSEAHGKERELRLYSCYGNVKSACWICNIQICTGCSHTRASCATSVSAHMELCQARCSKCFYSEINTLKYSCCCYDARRTAGWQSYNVYGTAVNHLLCRDCFRIGDKDRLDLRAKRDRETYTNLAQQPLACAKCNDALPFTGPLWWMCSKCSAECRSHDHPGWRRKLEL